MSIFHELLSIKAFRENKAEMSMRQQRSVLAEAALQRDSAEQRLVQFRELASARERALFDDLCSRIVRLRQIENVQLAVATMRGEERDHEQALEKSEAERNKEAAELEVRKAAHAQALKMKQKFVELAQVYAEEQFRELERKEDAEMEEAAETRRDRSDWDERAEEPV
jgi:type III secretion protein O